MTWWPWSFINPGTPPFSANTYITYSPSGPTSHILGAGCPPSRTASRRTPAVAGGGCPRPGGGRLPQGPPLPATWAGVQVCTLQLRGGKTCTAPHTQVNTPCPAQRANGSERGKTLDSPTEASSCASPRINTYPFWQNSKSWGWGVGSGIRSSSPGPCGPRRPRHPGCAVQAAGPRCTVGSPGR